jgi:hypothetical protein
VSSDLTNDNIIATDAMISTMNTFLLLDDVGIIAVSGGLSPQEQLVLNNFTNSSSNLSSSDLTSMISNGTISGYNSYYTVYSAEYRLYLLENELRLVRRYMIDMLGMMSAVLNDLYQIYSNQILIQWSAIDFNQRISALEAASSSGNSTMGNGTTSGNSTLVNSTLSGP